MYMCALFVQFHGRLLRVFWCPTHTKKFQIFSSYNNFFVCKKGKITVQPIFRGSENLRALYFFQEQLHFEVPHGQPFPMIQLVYAKIFQKKIYFHFNKKLLFQKKFIFDHEIVHQVHLKTFVISNFNTFILQYHLFFLYITIISIYEIVMH